MIDHMFPEAFGQFNALTLHIWNNLSEPGGKTEDLSKEGPEEPHQDLVFWSLTDDQSMGSG